jgi:hypothetical protein
MNCSITGIAASPNFEPSSGINTFENITSPPTI